MAAAPLEIPDFDASIDELRLDKEWVQHPKLYYTWARLAADANRAVEIASAQVKVVDAEMLLAIRLDPAEYGLDKATETTVPAAVKLTPEYKAAVKRLVEAKHTADVVRAAVATLEHRKRALESLVDLHGRSYFSTPRASTEAGADMVRKAERRVAGVKEDNED